MTQVTVKRALPLSKALVARPLEMLRQRLRHLSSDRGTLEGNEIDDSYQRCTITSCGLRIVSVSGRLMIAFQADRLSLS